MRPVCDKHRGKTYYCALCGVTLPTEPRLPQFDVPCSNCGYPRWCRARTVNERFVIEPLPDRMRETSDIERLTESLLRDRSVNRVELDLSAMDILGSLLLARLILLNKRVQPTKGRLLMTGLSPMVREVVRSTRMDRIFDVPGQ